jgi:hypothetical protein
MEKTTELARAMIATKQPFMITLGCDRNAGREVIVLIWPTRSTEIESSQLAAVTTAIVARTSGPSQPTTPDLNVEASRDLRARLRFAAV